MTETADRNTIRPQEERTRELDIEKAQVLAEAMDPHMSQRAEIRSAQDRLGGKIVEGAIFHGSDAVIDTSDIPDGMLPVNYPRGEVSMAQASIVSLGLKVEASKAAHSARKAEIAAETLYDEQQRRATKHT